MVATMELSIPEPLKRVFHPFEFQSPEQAFELYCSRAKLDPSDARGTLTRLKAWRARYQIRVFKPDEVNPYGRLAISHPIYPENAMVVISSSQQAPKTRFDVSLLDDHSVRPHGARLPPAEALAEAVQVATYYRTRFSPILPPHPWIHQYVQKVRRYLPG